ncbi:uncharacterized protein LOC131074470 isoform X4 [Cryptomeria japonica]|uniref:uncharacterized protein LOC131074470 isoform X4 n=1 Tax=Cryptomeria japonica TaxID=3369 RepID=UPI0027D9FFEF|nr:uncharacterized protein LOC131074470 isoform X4 [Cryptomeria japonica]
MIEKTDEVDGFTVFCSHGKLIVSINRVHWSIIPSLLGLKYLVISGDFFNQLIEDISRTLVWLRWFQIGQRNLPPGLSLRKLRVLELCERGEYHLEELLGETHDEAPVQLRQLLISECHKFQGFPNTMGHLIHLKKIVIIGGHNVRSLPDEFCLLLSLE